MTRLIQGHRSRDEDGFAMVLVLGISGVISLLIVAAVALSSASLKSSRAHTDFEGALAVSESGVDQTLKEINLAYNAGLPYSSNPACPITLPTTPFTDPNAERQAVLAAFASMPDSCLKSTPGGQYIAAVPANRQAVYSMGWAPSRAASQGKNRLVKAEYLFAPYKPSNAVLTQGALDFSGSVAITAPNSTTSADVHTNTNITGYNNSLNVDGKVSASGTLPSGCPSGVTGGCTASAPLQSLPTIQARTYYNTFAANLRSSGWFDLCPDGNVRQPAAGAAATPCTGPVVGGSGFNGWTYAAGSGTTPPIWTLPRTAGGPFPGIYYAYQGDAVIGSNGNSQDTWQITVLAESQTGVANTATCGKRGGNVTWKLFNMTPRLPGLQLLADANLTGDANASAGSGLFLAGDKIDFQTSSSVLTGAVVASNSCAAAGVNTIQGVTINYDDQVEGPLSDLIRTTLWLEYPAG